MRLFLFMEKENYERPKEQVRAEQIFYLIQMYGTLFAFGLFFVDWRCAVVAIGVLVWNSCFYASGCRSHVIDEYEQDGYPQDGLKRVYQSWIGLAICLVLVYFIFLKD